MRFSISSIFGDAKNARVSGCAAASAFGIWPSSAIASQARVSISSQISNLRCSDQSSRICGAGITINHRANIESGGETRQSDLYEKETSLRRNNRRSDAFRTRKVTKIYWQTRARCEAAVALHAHLAAAEKIGHRGDRFLGVFGAGADGENEVAEGEAWDVS